MNSPLRAKFPAPTPTPKSFFRAVINLPRTFACETSGELDSSPFHLSASSPASLHAQRRKEDERRETFNQQIVIEMEKFCLCPRNFPFKLKCNSIDAADLAECSMSRCSVSVACTNLKFFYTETCR